MSGIPAPLLKLRANNPASYAGYDDLRTLQHQCSDICCRRFPRRGSDNFRRLPNVAVRSSKPWRDLVSFLLRTHTQHLAPFTAGLFCLESELHFSRNCESGVRNCSFRMWLLVRGQWTCHVVVFVDSTSGYRITLTQHNHWHGISLYGFWPLCPKTGYLILGKSAPSKRGLNLPQTGS